MRHLLASLLLFAASLAPAATDTVDIEKMLNHFHEAASKADGPTYFGFFAPEGVFLGTDARERWTVQQFKEYAEPHFSKGKGWTYRPTTRHVHVLNSGKTAWFDELLENQKYGVCRGTGVVRKVKGRWKVSQYHLTLPIPNELIDSVAKMIGVPESIAAPGPKCPTGQRASMCPQGGTADSPAAWTCLPENKDCPQYPSTPSGH